MNYTSTIRSNYFRVKDRSQFIIFCSQWGLTPNDRGELAGFTVRESIYNDNDELSFDEELAKQLQRGEVCIYMEAGYEGARYITGQAIAVNSSGKMESVSLDEIYRRAKKLSKKPITRCEY